MRSDILRRILLALYIVLIFALSSLPRASPLESAMSVYILLHPNVQLFMLLLMLMSFVVLLANDRTIALTFTLVLFAITYNPELLIFSGLDDHAFYGALSVSSRIVEYGHTWFVDNVFINWPAPFLLNSILHIIAGYDIVLSAMLMKTVYLLLTVMICHIVCTKVKLGIGNVVERVYFIVPLALLYIFKFYQLTTASFTSLFTILNYLLFFKNRWSLGDYIYTTIVLVILPFSHGFSTLSLIALLIYLLTQGVNKRGMQIISLIGLISSISIIIYTYKQYVLEMGLRAVKVLLDLLSREDISILIPAHSESIYSRTYRLTLELCVSPILVIMALGIVSKLRNRIYWQNMFLPLLSIFTPAVFVEYSTETIPRLTALSIVFLTIAFIDGYGVVLRLNRRIASFIQYLLIVVTAIMITVALVGQPFRFVADDGVDRFLEAYKPQTYTVDEHIRLFRVKSFINELFYYEEAANELISLKEDIMRHSLIFYGAYSKQWNFPSLVLYYN